MSIQARRLLRMTPHLPESLDHSGEPADPPTRRPVMKYNNILEAIGNTPHVRINRLFGGDHQVWLKLERQNPGGSIKDRIGLAMVEDAERRGVLTKDTVIVEPTSGNPGIRL